MEHKVSVYWGNIGIMEKKMETTIRGLYRGLGFRATVVPFAPFCFGVSLLKLKIRKKGTRIIKGLLWNLGLYRDYIPFFPTKN